MATLRVRNLRHDTYRRLAELAQASGCDVAALVRLILDDWAASPDHALRAWADRLERRADYLARTDPRRPGAPS